MLTDAKILFKRYNITSVTQTKVKNRLKNMIFNIRIQGGLKTRIAPIFHPLTLLKLIKSLWLDKQHHNSRLFLAKKQAATQAMICLVTGRRWTDITRIKWDNMTHISNNIGTFIKFFIPVSKTNMIGSRIECVTLKKLNITPCPVKMLEKLKFWSGQPSNGFVFKCLAPHRQWVRDPIQYNWSTYRCNGHWTNNLKQACLGQTSSNQSFGYLHRWAKHQKWRTLPTKHTFRRTCLLVSKQLGITRDQINEGFGWVAHSDMIRHYTSEHDSVTLKAPAVAIAKYLEKPIKHACLHNIPFINPYTVVIIIIQTEMAEYDQTDPPNTSLYIDAYPINTYPDLLEELKTKPWISPEGIQFDEERIAKFQQKIRNRPWEIACRLDIPKQMIDLAISIKFVMGYESAEAVQLIIPNLEKKLRIAVKSDSAESLLAVSSARRKKPTQFTFTKCEACQQILRDTSDDENAIRECLPAAKKPVHKTVKFLQTQNSIPSISSGATTSAPTSLAPIEPPRTSKYHHGKPKSSLTKGSRKPRTLCPRGSPGSVILPQVGSPEFDGIWNIPSYEDNTPLTELETELANDSDDLPVSVISDN